MTEKTFQLAVIGCGRWGKNHVRTASQLWGKSLKYICDVDQAQGKQAQELAPEAIFTPYLQDVLKDEAVAAVVVATPAETHFQVARAALEAGKHVLVEKPLALFSGDAEQLQQLARKQKRVLMVGHILLFHPAIRKIKELIDTGVIGKLQYIYSNRLNLGTVRKEENILWSFAPHDISVLQYLIGADPIEVDAKGGIFLQPGIHDVTLTQLTFPHNVLAHIHVSWLHPFKEHRLVVIGDRNMVVFEDSRKENKLVLYPKGIDWVAGEPIKRESDFQVIEFEAAQPLQMELEHFRRCVETNTTPIADGENGVSVLKVLEKAQACLEKQVVVNEETPAEAKSVAGQNYFVHPTAVVDEGCEIGEGTKIWHYSHVQSGAKIGKKCSLGQNVNVGNNVKIGNGVKIQNNVSVYEGVELEDFVFCGPSMVFTNVLNPRSEFPQRGGEFYVPTKVCYGASIGANATIVCGVTIGRFAFIGAGAVIVKDVPDYALMVGNPARQVGWMCRCGTRLKLQKNQAACSKCGREYQQKGSRLSCVKETEKED